MAGLFASQSPRKPALLYTDGASRGNPGASGWGAALLAAHDHSVIAKASGALPDTTNNVAEYTGALEGVRLALLHGVTDLEIRADSQLLVRQLTGEYRIKAAHLLPLAVEIRKLLAQFVFWRAVHIPREQNKLADRLSNDGADEAERLYHRRR